MLGVEILFGIIEKKRPTEKGWVSFWVVESGITKKPYSERIPAS